MIYFISSFDVTNVIVHSALQIKTFLWIPASATDAAISPNGIKTLSASFRSTFFVNNKSIFINGPRSLPRNPPDCIF